MVSHLLFLLLIVVILGLKVKIIIERPSGSGPVRSRIGPPPVIIVFIAHKRMLMVNETSRHINAIFMFEYENRKAGGNSPAG
jgi:hypothetical protein